MDIHALLIIAGIIVLVLGIIFQFQGKSMIGPSSSFMYANPEWITYGIQIAIIGVIIMSIGITIYFIQKIH